MAIGVVFIPIGVFLLNTSSRIQEYKFDYTKCADESGTKCADIVANYTLARTTKCECSINFKLNETMDKDAFLYYALSNFYQNHRRYVRSRNDWQLNGYTKLETLTSCMPFDRALDEKRNQTMLVAPCGAIANSIFNDTFQLYYQLPDKPAKQVGLLENEISWPTDRKYKFRNPTNLKELEKFTHPVNWNTYLQDFQSGNSTAFENEHLIVWMRSAALPNFRKLYARVDHTVEEFRLGLPKGNYKMKIEYSKFLPLHFISRGIQLKFNRNFELTTNLYSCPRLSGHPVRWQKAVHSVQHLLAGRQESVSRRRLYRNR